MNIALGSQERHIITRIREARRKARQIRQKFTPSERERLPRSMRRKTGDAGHAELPAVAEGLSVAHVSRKVAATEKVRGRGKPGIIENRLRRSVALIAIVIRLHGEI